MKIHNCVLAIVMAAALAACGGGGGSSGTPAFGGGTGGGTDTGTGGGTVTPATYVMQLQLQTSAGVDIASNSFAASDTVKLLATLKTSAGVAVANEVVTFAESGGGLLQFTPTAATALTNASGQAMIEIKAATLTSQGASTVSATATLGGTAYAASRNLQITGAVGTDPQALAKAVNFVAAAPADKSIVIAGAGGNGRSETAILQYKVVNGAGAAVPGVIVTFEAIPANVVTLNSATGTTDASGLVSASVSSKSTATSVVVKATVTGSALLTQSDTLTVTTGTAVPAAFDLAASKYVLNLDLSGDSSMIRVGVADANGNPVADGFPVIATTIYGRVGTSDRGGCTTINGLCEIEYQVQNPRPADGERIPVVVTGQAYSAREGKDVTISDTIYLNATSVHKVGLYASNSNAKVTTFPTLPFDLTCKAMWVGELGTEKGFAAPAGTTLTVDTTSTVVSASVTSGVPVMDVLNNRTSDEASTANNTRTRVVLSFNLTGATRAGSAQLVFTATAGSSVQQFPVTVEYEPCSPIAPV